MLRINAECQPGGRFKRNWRVLTARHCRAARSRMPSRTFADAEPLSGDHHHAPLAWRNGDIAAPMGTPCSLRFRLDRAAVFYVDFD